MSLASQDGPYAYRSPLGWISHSADVLESRVERFWKLDGISVYEHSDLAMSAEKKR